MAGGISLLSFAFCCICAFICVALGSPDLGIICAIMAVANVPLIIDARR